MKKIIIILLLFLAADVAGSEMVKIIRHIESSGRDWIKGDDGLSWGAYQIRPDVVKDVNRRYTTSYEHADAFDKRCAEEILILYVHMWGSHLTKKLGRPATEEDLVRIWNGGPRGYKKKATLDYLERYNKYKEEMNKRECLVNGQLGLVMNSYTHTCDVYMFKSRSMLHGVQRKLVKLQPRRQPPDKNQIRLPLWRREDT